MTSAELNYRRAHSSKDPPFWSSSRLGANHVRSSPETLPEFHLDHPSWLTFLVARGELEEVRTKYGALAPSAGALVVADPTERVAKSFKSSSTPHAFILESALVRARGLASGADSLETLAQAARVSPSDPAAPQPREHAMASLSQH